MNRLFLVFLVLLAGCSNLPAPGGTLSQQPQDWYFRYSSGMPDHPAAPWQFAFPQAPGSVHYVTTLYRPATSVTGKTLTLTFKITSESAVYGLAEAGTYPPIDMHLFLQRAGDDMSAVGDMQYYRWWCKDSEYVLGSGDGATVAVSCPLTWDVWSSVYSKADDAHFQATLDDLQWVGFTFGGSAGWGHGVYVQSGVSTFSLLSMAIQ